MKMRKEKEQKLILAEVTDKWGECFSKYVTPKRLAFLLTIVYIFGLIPLFWISFYNYPSADDYSIGSNCRQIWVQSHNIFAVLWGGVLRAVEDWLHWMGYYTSNFLMAVPPSTFGERCYVATAWIMLLALTFSTWYLLKAIFVKVFHADKYVSHSVIMLLLFVTVQCMVGRVEAFFWYSGAANYILVHCMSLFFYGLLISAVYDKGRKKKFDLITASFFAFLTGGGNQMTALNVAVVLLFAIGLGAFFKRWKEHRALLIPIGIYFLGFVLNIAAPGNWIRAEGVGGMNPIKAVMVSFYYCLEYCIGEWTGWPVVVLVIVLVPLFWKMTNKTEFQFSYPLIVVLFGYCLVSAMMTPPLFAVGNIDAARLQALTFTMYLLVLVLCEGYVIGWARKKMQQESNSRTDGYSVNELWCLVSCLLFFAVAAGLTVIPEPHYFTTSSAIMDLADGSAKAYGDALKERMILYNSGEQNVVVKPLPTEPKLLYFSDIGEDAGDWENKGLCRYYGIEAVWVEK